MLSMHKPEGPDPAETLRLQLEQIATESAARQKIIDAEDEERIRKLSIGTQAALDGLARASDEIARLPKMEKDDPSSHPPRLSDLL